jgi:hypothetical protein
MELMGTIKKVAINLKRMMLLIDSKDNKMYKAQQSYDDFIQLDSDMSHVDDEDLFSLAERITVPEPHIINEMWADDEKYDWKDVARCLRDNWHEIKGLVSLIDRDKMTDFAFDNHFE